MSLATRTILILTLLLAAFGELFAQEETATAATTTTAATSTATSTAAPAETEKAAVAAETEERNVYEIRNQFSAMLQRHPYELRMILRLDPTLLTDDNFVGRYKELEKFLARNPEVRENPRFYVAEFAMPGQRSRLGDILEPLIILFTMVVIGFALAWVVRMMIEQKRWNRLSRTQSEVHNKILDRFSTSTELLEYIKTPAGTKFLESAPIPVHTTSSAARVAHPPQARVLWSIQLGVIVAAAALGMMMVSGSMEKDDAQALFAMGVISLCVGLGFIGSAAVSLFLSRKLGLWAQPQSDQNSVQ
ncbi:MAG TPA: hypothetical protein VGF48_06080 [Thermoanaerobaculia bacterium]|jgi:hypothetical protein